MWEKQKNFFYLFLKKNTKNNEIIVCKDGLKLYLIISENLKFSSCRVHE